MSCIRSHSGYIERLVLTNAQGGTQQAVRVLGARLGLGWE